VRVLLVEDDRATRELIERGLAAHGMRVYSAGNLAAAAASVDSQPWDAIVLDVMLPDGEGFELVRRLRAARSAIPVVFVSARGDVTDRLRGFELGGDDYLKKPFALAELAARLKVVARRPVGAAADDVLRVADLTLDTRRRRVERGGRPVALSTRQFDVLEYFMRHRGFVVSRSMLVEAVWGHGFETRSNAIDVQIKNLRDRIDRDPQVKLLHTVRGVGYLLEARPADAGEAGPARG
jgi:two-component system copper resistance phosphate regulon response regulator CusR